MLIISHSPEETKKAAADWLARISAQATDPKEAVIVGLSGHLGSGKTTFVQYVADSLGIKEFITSPTFVIMKIYPTTRPTFKKLVHIDAYRLEKGRDLEALDFERLVSDPGNLILIEWPENVKEILPESTHTISFEAVGDNDRQIIYT